MKASLLFLLLWVLSAWQVASAQTPIDTTHGRFYQPIFPTVAVSSGVVYGSAVGVFGNQQQLLMDIYQPVGDVAAQRPVIIFAHQGGFVQGSRSEQYMVDVCTRFAKLGYVTASIDYRLLFTTFDTTGVSKAALRGMQDLRAAVRFFRQDAATVNAYRVSPSRIVVGGASAGGFMALEVGYLDKINEVPSDVDINAMGGIEGTSGNPGYSSLPLAVLNLSGATNPPSMIEPGNPPLYSAHGTSDATVPYLKGRVGAGLPPKYVFGSGLLNPYASTQGVPNVLRRFSKAPHIPQYTTSGSTNPAAYADTTFRDIRDFLRPLLVPVTALPSLVINTPTSVPGGSYQDITINSSQALLTGNITVYGTLVIKSLPGQTPGSLKTNCFVVDGPGNFELQAGAALRICDPNGISASGATGAIRNTGSRTFSNDAVYAYEGVTNQTTGTGLPAQVRELEIALTAGSTATLTNPVAISQRFVPTSGALSVSTSQSLTLLSGPAGTALVTPGPGTLTGGLTAQRYLDPSVNPGLGYRHLTIPFNVGVFVGVSATSFTPIFNTAYNSSTRPDLVTPFPNIFAYDQQRAVTSPATSYSEFDKGWVVPANPVTTPALPSRQGFGYAVNIAAGQTLSLTGSLSSNNQDFTVSLPAGATPTAGWHLVGNPFLSALNWDNVPIPAGMSPAMYIYVSTGQYVGQYRTYINGIGGTGATIPLGQGFFVRTPVAATLSFPLTARITDFAAANTATVQRGTANTRPLLRLTLANPATPADLDETYLYLEAGATAGPDLAFDADKMPNPSGLNLASVAGSKQLAINGLPLLSASTVVPLALTVPQPGAYVLTAAQLVNFAPGTAITLTDAQTGTRTLLGLGTRYTFNMAAATAPGRFALELSAANVTATAGQTLAAQLQLYPNPASGSFRVLLPMPAGSAATSVPTWLTNRLGQTVSRQALPLHPGQPLDAVVDVHGLAPGIYQVHLTVAGLPVVRRVVLQ